MFKKSKLISSLIPLAVLSIFASITGVRAEESTNNNVYEVTDAYKVEIPAEISVDESGKDTLHIYTSLSAYSELNISINSVNNFVLKCENVSEGLSYSLKCEGNEDNKITYTTNQEKEWEVLPEEIGIQVTGKDNAKVSGTYQDTLTFSMDYQKLRYKLTYDSNDGDVTPNCQWLENNTAYGTLPVLTREGYNFLGWYTDANGGTEVDANTTMQGADTTIYAHWKPIQYTIQYNNNSKVHTNATGEMQPSSVAYGSWVKLSKNTFTNSDGGAQFVGWNTEPDGSGVEYTYEAEVSNLTTKDKATITLYAQWKYKNEVIVHFEDVNGNMDNDTKTVISEILPADETVSWSVENLTEYEKNKTQWEKQWQTPDNNGAVNYTTTNASKTTTIDIKRQTYYLDLNAQWLNSDETSASGGGNLSWNGVETATVQVVVNGKIEKSNVADYFVRHKYGSKFQFIVTVKSGYELKGISVGEGQESSCITCEGNSVTGIVTGARYVKNDSGNEYYATTVALVIKKIASQSDDGDVVQSEDELVTQNTEFVSNEENTSVDIDTTDSTIPCDTDLEWENPNTEDALAQDENSDNQILSETGQTAENLNIQEIEPDQMQAESEPENEADESFSE